MISKAFFSAVFYDISFVPSLNTDIISDLSCDSASFVCFRIRELRVEVQDLKQRNQSLEKDTTELYSRLDSTKKEVRHI